MDEGQLLAYPELVRRGAIPNLDFENSYGPANLWVLSLAFELLGASVISERLVGVCYRLLIVAGVYAFALVLAGEANHFAQKLRPHSVACVAALTSAAFLAGSGCHAYAWFGGMVAALGSIHSLYRGLAGVNHRALVQGGLLAGVAVSFRLDLSLAVGLSALPLVLAASGRGKCSYALGLGLGLLPLAAHVARVGIARAWQGLFVETVLLAGPGRRLPLPPGGLLRALFFFAAILVVAALLWFAVRALAAAPLNVCGRVRLALAALSVGALPQLLQRADVLHAIHAACVALPLLPVAALLGQRGARRQAYRALAIASASIAVVSSGANLAKALASVRWLEHAGRRFPLEPALAASLEPVLREIDARAPTGAQLFVGPRDLRRSNVADTFLYFMLPRLQPASYFTEMNPGVANAPGSSLARDIEQADFLILTSRFDSWNESNASAHLGPEAPRQVVDNHFCRLLTSGTFELYERCDRLGVPLMIASD